MTALGLRPRRRLGLSPRRRRRTPAFVPGDLAGLAGWYQAGSLQNTITAGAVVQGFDLSGGGRHLTATSSGARPLDQTDPDGRATWRFDGVNDALRTTSPPSLAAGITMFIAYRIRAHVNGQGIIGAGRAGDGPGKNLWFEFTSAFSANRTNLQAKAAQVDAILTPQRADPTDRTYAVITIADTSAEVRDLLGSVSDTSTSAALGTPDIIGIGARISNQFLASPHGNIDVYEFGFYDRVLNASELDQIETYLAARHAIAWSPGYLLADLAWWHDDWSAFTLTGNDVDQWNDRSGNGRHWAASGTDRPERTTDAGLNVVRFDDGDPNVMAMAGTLPALEPVTAMAVFRVRNRADFAGLMSASAAAGVDHAQYWTFQQATAASGNNQLFGRSTETPPNDLVITRPDTGAVTVALWTTNAGSAELHDTAGSGSDSYGGSFGTPSAIVLGARYNAGAFGYADLDVMATLGVDRVVSGAERDELLAWATREWGAV